MKHLICLRRICRHILPLQLAVLTLGICRASTVDSASAAHFVYLFNRGYDGDFSQSGSTVAPGPLSYWGNACAANGDGFCADLFAQATDSSGSVTLKAKANMTDQNVVFDVNSGTPFLRGWSASSEYSYASASFRQDGGAGVIPNGSMSLVLDYVADLRGGSNSSYAYGSSFSSIIVKTGTTSESVTCASGHRCITPALPTGGNSFFEIDLHVESYISVNPCPATGPCVDPLVIPYSAYAIADASHTLSLAGINVYDANGKLDPIASANVLPGFGSITDSSAAPEPGTIVLLGFGLALVAGSKLARVSHKARKQ